MYSLKSLTDNLAFLHAVHRENLTPEQRAKEDFEDRIQTIIDGFIIAIAGGVILSVTVVPWAIGLAKMARWVEAR